MTDTSKDGGLVFWQDNKEMGAGEPAILMEGYSDTIALTQDSSVINLNYDSLNEFIKNLRTLQRNRI